MTTRPPVDRSSVSRFCGSAATSAGTIKADGAGAGAGAGFAAIRAIAIKGNANKAFDIMIRLSRERLAYRTEANFASAICAF